MTTLHWLMILAGGWLLYSAVLNHSPMGALTNTLQGKASTAAAASHPIFLPNLGGGFPGSQGGGSNPPGNGGEGQVPNLGHGPKYMV